MADTSKIEVAARAICESKGRKPDAQTNHGFDPFELERLGFPGYSPFKQGLWVCYIEEGAKLTAVFDALSAASGNQSS